MDVEKFSVILQPENTKWCLIFLSPLFIALNKLNINEQTDVCRLQMFRPGKENRNRRSSEEEEGEEAQWGANGASANIVRCLLLVERLPASFQLESAPSGDPPI